MLISKKRRDIEDIDETCEKPKKIMRQISLDSGFSSRILNGPYAKKLSDRHYFEMTDDTHRWTTEYMLVTKPKHEVFLR